MYPLTLYQTYIHISIVYVLFLIKFKTRPKLFLYKKTLFKSFLTIWRPREELNKQILIFVENQRESLFFNAKCQCFWKIMSILF